MEFLIELLKEFVKACIREISAYIIRKQILDKGSKKPTPRRRKLKGGSRKKK